MTFDLDKEYERTNERKYGCVFVSLKELKAEVILVQSSLLPPLFREIVTNENTLTVENFIKRTETTKKY